MSSRGLVLRRPASTTFPPLLSCNQVLPGAGAQFVIRSSRGLALRGLQAQCFHHCYLQSFATITAIHAIMHSRGLVLRKQPSNKFNLTVPAALPFLSPRYLLPTQSMRSHGQSELPSVTHQGCAMSHIRCTEQAVLWHLVTWLRRFYWGNRPTPTHIGVPTPGPPHQLQVSNPLPFCER